jgi:peptide/nickel transport system substrate-binding protein
VIDRTTSIRNDPTERANMTRRCPSTRRRPLTAASIVLAALALAACGSSSSSSKSAASGTSGASGASASTPATTHTTLTAALLGDIGQPPDPSTFYAGNGIAIIKNVYEGLVQYGNNTASVVIAPQLATSWSVSKAFTVYTFHLRHGVTFHDGTPFTSASVGPSFTRTATLKGGPAYLAAVVKSVATPDPYTAVVTLKQPNSAFLNYLASPFSPKMFSPTGLKLHAGSDQAQTYLRTHDLGSGPYELTTAQVGREYVLTQYPNYWGPKGPFKTINLPVYTQASAMELAFQKGDVNLIVGDNAPPSSAIPQYASDSSVNSYFLPMYTATLITTNPNRPFFRTQKARIAFLEAINSSQLVSQVINSKLATPATTIYGAGFIPGGLDKQSIPYNPAAMKAYAKTLPAGSTLTIGYLSSVPNGQLMANIIAAQMQADGVNAKVLGVTTSTLFSWPQHPATAADTYIDASDGPDGADPYMWGHVFWDKSGGIDLLQCDVPQVDAELNKAVQSNDTALYVKAAQQYTANGCSLHVANLGDWVLASKWITGIPQAHNLGAFEVAFNLLGVK